MCGELQRKVSDLNVELQSSQRRVHQLELQLHSSQSRPRVVVQQQSQQQVCTCSYEMTFYNSMAFQV